MFALVADVESYPAFVPLCTGMVIRSRTADGDKQVILARMTVAYGFLHESFTSRVTLDPAGLRITAEALDGPFRKLDNLWHFEPLGPRQCTVNFSLEYEFRSRALGLVVGAVFDRAFRRFTAAFRERADAIYGLNRARAAEEEPAPRGPS